MNQEEKELLLKDLSARLPYKVMCKVEYVGTIVDIIIPLSTDLLDEFIDHKCEVNPYLRPMSSMTNEEKKIIEECNFIYDAADKDIYNYNRIAGSIIIQEDIVDISDFCNSHHLDWRGLIPKGLAIEAPEDMYKFE